MRRLVASLAVASLLAGCSSRPATTRDAPSVRTVAAGDTFALAIGDTVRLGGLTLRFVSVAEDSRCPRTVTCVWEGNARVNLVTVDGAGRQDVPLSTSARFERRATIAGGVLELRGLDPSPPVGDPKTYVATLHFEAET